MYGKGFLGNMAENLHADYVQSRQAGFMQRFLNTYRPCRLLPELLLPVLPSECLQRHSR